MLQAKYDSDATSADEKISLKKQISENNKKIEDAQDLIKGYKDIESYSDKRTEAAKEYEKQVVFAETLRNKDGDLGKLPVNMKEYADEIGKAVAKAISEQKLNSKFDKLQGAKFTADGQVGSEITEAMTKALKNNSTMDEAKVRNMLKNAKVDAQFDSSQFNTIKQLINNEIAVLKSLSGTNGGKISDKDIKNSVENILKQILDEMKKSKKK